MKAFKAFCLNHKIVDERSGLAFVKDCGTVLSFLYEFRSSYSEEDWRFVKELYDGEILDIESWIQDEEEWQWILNIQSIKVFPPYDVLMDVKRKTEESLSVIWSSAE